jgi:hypothetical protein
MDDQRVQSIGKLIAAQETYAVGSPKSHFVDDLWQPYRSAEGGNPTIGYGHKLTDAEAESGNIKIDGKDVQYGGGLTDPQAKYLLHQSIREGIRAAKLPDDMPDEHVALAMDVAHRVGPNLRRNAGRFLGKLESGDLAGAYAETGDLFYTPHDEEGNALPRKYYNARNSRIFAAAGYNPTEEAQVAYNNKQRESMGRDPTQVVSTGDGLQDLYAVAGSGQNYDDGTRKTDGTINMNYLADGGTVRSDEQFAEYTRRAEREPLMYQSPERMKELMAEAANRKELLEESRRNPRKKVADMTADEQFAEYTRRAEREPLMYQSPERMKELMAEAANRKELLAGARRDRHELSEAKHMQGLVAERDRLTAELERINAALQPRETNGYLEGGTVRSVASKGRYGDTTLMHVNPREVEGLEALARSKGKEVTYNPETGLPEAFNFATDVLPSLAAVAAAALAAPTGGMTLAALPAVMGAAGAAGGLTKGVAVEATGGEDALEQGLTSALTSAAGAGIGGGLAIEAPATGLIQQGAAKGFAQGAQDMGMSQASNLGVSGLGEGMTAEALGQGVGNVGTGFDAAIQSANVGTGTGWDVGAANFDWGVADVGAGVDVGAGAATAVPSGAPSGVVPAGADQGFTTAGSEFKAGTDYLGEVPSFHTVEPVPQPSYGEQISKGFGDLGTSVQEGAGELSERAADLGPRLIEQGDQTWEGLKTLDTVGKVGDWAGKTPNTVSLLGGAAGLGLEADYDARKAAEAEGLGFEQDKEAKRQSYWDTVNAINSSYGRIGRTPPVSPGGGSWASGPGFAHGGLADLHGSGRGRYIQGRGTGESDSIPAVVDGREPARISSGEFVVPARTVQAAGGPESFASVLDRITRARGMKDRQRV